MELGVQREIFQTEHGPSSFRPSAIYSPRVKCDRRPRHLKHETVDCVKSQLQRQTPAHPRSRAAGHYTASLLL